MNKQELIKSCFNEFTGKNVDVLERLYDSQITFKDPITEVRGLEALKSYYDHAYSKVKNIRFDFHTMHEGDDTITGEWNMHLEVTGLNWGKPYTVKGVSILKFSEESGKVIFHRDYLDIGEMVYEQIPGLGAAIKAVKSRLH